MMIFLEFNFYLVLINQKKKVSINVMFESKRVFAENAKF